MNVQSIFSRTYSSCSSLKTWALNCHRTRIRYSCIQILNYAHLLLQFLVSIVDAELLETILPEMLKSVDILHSKALIRAAMPK